MVWFYRFNFNLVYFMNVDLLVKYRTAMFYGQLHHPISMCLQIPGGYLADRCSAKLMILVSVLAPSMFTLLVPVVARWNFTALVALRVVTGLLSVSKIMATFVFELMPHTPSQ